MKEGMRETLVTEWIFVCSLQGIKRPTTTMRDDKQVLFEARVCNNLLYSNRKLIHHQKE